MILFTIIYQPTLLKNVMNYFSLPMNINSFYSHDISSMHTQVLKHDGTWLKTKINGS